MAENSQANKRALLGQLRIDRSPGRQPPLRLLRWVLPAALVAAAGAALWFFRFPGGEGALPVNAVAVQAAAPAVQAELPAAQGDAPAAGASVLDATGYVVARRQATVSSKDTGKIIEVLIEEGVAVEKGQLLARLDDSIPRAQLALARSELEAARRRLDEIQVQLKQGRLDLRRMEELAVRELASQADLDRARLSVEGLIARLASARQNIAVAERSLAVQRQVVEDAMIRAPFTGVVIAKAAQPGEMISPVSAGGGFTRTGICTIVDMRSLEVEVDVNEAYINRVRPGQPARVALNAYPEDGYAAQVIAIIPAADRTKATVRVRIGFLERDERVLPDMGARVAFLKEEARGEGQAAPLGSSLSGQAIGRRGGEAESGLDGGKAAS